jgi:hypothetical protein
MALVIIKNTRRTACSNCGGVHAHITKPTENRPCSTPVAYEDDKARKIAPMLAHGEDDIERIPTGTDIVLAEGARKLPVRPDAGLQVFTASERAQ